MECEIGMVGLGVMGRNLLLNIAEHGFSIAGYDSDKEKVDELNNLIHNRKIVATDNLKEFIKSLKAPRNIMMLVPAGSIVDSVIEELLPYLNKDDIIIDGGNSYFKDTNLRGHNLQDRGIYFFGVGISGGEEGARFGPSLMPGGDKSAYERIRPFLEKASAKVNGEPCVAYLGSGSSGHYVKMVHNGIEYALMQLIAETYDLMKRGLLLNDDELHDIYSEWNEGDLNSYLLEISSQIFLKIDEKTGRRLINEILDVAKQKGTGMWTSQSAMELQLPIPSIDMAVSMRDLSMWENLRKKANNVLNHPIKPFTGKREEFLNHLKEAFYVGMMVAYAQGMALLHLASEKLNYGLNLEDVAKIWRGGCIIRSKFLEDIRKAYQKNPDLLNLIVDETLGQRIISRRDHLSWIITKGVEMGIPIPGLMATIGYIDAYRSEKLPANLIQAQRDYFGAHSYERVDAKGTYHTEWEEGLKEKEEAYTR